MHVGYVLKKFPRLSETFILGEILELERQGIEVTVFSLHRPDDGVFHAALAELGKPVVYLNLLKGAEFCALLAPEARRLAERAAEVGRLAARALSFGRLDVAQILNWGAQVALEAERRGIERLHAHFATIATQVARAAKAFTGIPFSFTCHAKDIYRETVLPEQFRELAGAADFVVTVCDANRRWIQEKLGCGEGTDVRRLYNGIDLESFDPKARRERARPLILGVGRLVEKKGFADLIEAGRLLFAEGRDFDLWIAGDGDQRAVLEARIAELGRPEIRLLGPQPVEEVRALMAEATVLALPCVVGEDGNRDALPTVLLEALALGLPAVSCPVAGVPEILDGGRAGVLVPEHDPAALARALGALLDDPECRRALAEAGRKRAEELFDRRKNGATLAAWFMGRGPAEG